MNYRQAVADLEGRQSEAMPEPTLDRIGELVSLLDHPELTYPSIHVTGTNGKTSTARMLTALACAHGLSTGTFISPHVTSLLERLSVCGREMTEEEFGDEYQRLLPYFDQVGRVSGKRVTYFDALTAMAYLWFADKPVALGVFEVGMGGTWDATNLIRGDVAVLCPIGVDHRELGTTPGQVAVEKSGIIKEGRIAVVRIQVPEAMAVIQARARAMGADVLEEERDFEVVARAKAVGGQSISIRAPHAAYPEVFLPLYGEQLARNAAAALTGMEALLGRALDQPAVTAAFGIVRSPGRMEVVGRHPLVVLDGAHNPDAARALAAALPESFRWDRLHLVMGIFADKDVEGVVQILAPLADRGYACRSSSPRAAPTERVVAALHAAGLSDVEAFPSVPWAVDAAQAAAQEGDLILVTGSLYTVADARPSFVGA